MKKSVFLGCLITLLFVPSAPMMAGWWPYEKYGEVIRRIEMDKAWTFSHSNTKDWEWSDPEGNEVGLRDAPGYIAWQLLTWNNRKLIPNDYDLDYMKLILYYGSHELEIAQVDCYPEKDYGGTGSWEENWKGDGNVNTTVDGKWTIDYHGKTRFCHKYLFTNYINGSQFAYMITKYDQAIIDFINAAGDNLCIQVKGEFDSGSSDYWNLSKATAWPSKERPRIQNTLNSIQVSDVKYVGSQLQIQLPKLDNIANYMYVECSLTGNKKQFAKGEDNKHIIWETTKMDDWTHVNDGNYSFKTWQVREFPQDLHGYANAKEILPAVLYHESQPLYAEIPQLRLPRNTNVRNNNDGTLTLTWNADVPAQGRTFDSSKWVVFYCKDGKFDPNSTQIFKVDYNKDQTLYTQTITVPERNKGNVTYYFRVARDHTFTQQARFWGSCQVTVNTNYVKINTCTPTVNGKNVTFKWTLTGGIWTSNMRLQLYKSNQLFHETSSTVSPGSYTTSDFPTCVKVPCMMKVVEGAVTHSQFQVDTVVVNETAPAELTYFTASKGYFNNHIELKWTIDSIKENFTTFTIFRKAHDADIAAASPIAVVQRKAGVYAYSYTDNQIVPNVYYDYLLLGSSKCAGNVEARYGLVDVGYAHPNGVVTGQVLFENGQAVKDVTIDMTGENISRGASLEITGDSYVKLDCKQHGTPFSMDGGTVEMFVYLNQGTTPRTLFYQKDAASLILTDDTHLQATLYRNNTPYSLTVALSDTMHWEKEDFNHVAMSYSHVNQHLILNLYINGQLIKTQTINSVQSTSGIGASTEDICFGYNPATKASLNGFMDEIRLWSICRTPEQIASTHDCFLNGRETGISGYYHCDLIIDSRTFDLSGDGVTFNERHLDVVNRVFCNVNYVPSAQRMGLRAHTDARGNYLINAASYTKQGTLYTLIPSLGVHQFSPETKTLFFDNNASTHNNIDITDISSFKVSGTVMYAGGTYPVEGVQFKVDGVIQLSREGSPVMTDEKGHFSLSVPVGIHSVQAFKGGHTFTNNGFIVDHEGKDINYQDAQSGIQMQDSTRVRFIGRICGGDIQAAKAVGFSLSRNNLQDGIFLRLEHNHPDVYAIVSDTCSTTMTHQPLSIYALDKLNPKRKYQARSNRVEYNKNDITIFINDSTGEFYADVPPIDYTLRLSLGNKYGPASESGDPLNLSSVSPLTPIKEPYAYQDSIVVKVQGDSLKFSSPETITDTITYHRKQVFEIHTTPVVKMVQVDNQHQPYAYYGEAYTSIRLENGNFKSVKLLDIQKDSIRYALSRPLFLHSAAYIMECSLVEEYKHYTKAGVATWSETVPVTDAVFKITNTMCDERNVTLLGNEQGKAWYNFTTSTPDLNKAEGQLALHVTYNKNKSACDWSSRDFQNGLCFFTGEKKTSGDFITAGPNDLITILRDPPGSNSYSYLDAGHTIQKDKSYCYSPYEEGHLGINITFGLDCENYIGLGFATKSAIEATRNINLAYEHEHQWSHKNTLNTTTTTTQRIATSSDETFVGANADVFVGSSSNYSLATSQQVYLVDSAQYRKYGPDKFTKIFAVSADSTYVLTVSTGVSCSQKFNTIFAYTQDDIENQEIPRLQDALKDIVKPYNKQDSARYAHLADSLRCLYYMRAKNFDPSKKELGDEGTYFVIQPKYKKGETKLMGDTVMAVYGWITRWRWCMGANEYHKWKAYQCRDQKGVLIDNYSLAASTLSFSENYSTSRGFNYVYETKHGAYGNYSTSNNVKTISHFGINAIMEEHAGASDAIDNQTTSQYQHTKGFEIVPNTYERLSVDVLREAWWNEADEWADYGDWEVVKKEKLGNNTDEVTKKISAKSSYPSFIFRTRGGSTCCPYEPEVQTKYIEYFLKEYIQTQRKLIKTDSDTTQRAKIIAEMEADLKAIAGNTQKLNESTLKIDNPTVRLGKYSVDGVPSGENAYIPIEMTNNSESGTERPYYLVYKESSNNKGLSVSIDGTALGTGLTGGSGVSFLIPAGATLKKTLTIAKGSSLDYEDITLYLVASCNEFANKFAVKDSCTFSVHFTPACSGIDIKTPGTGWVYNTELRTAVNPASKKTEHYLPVELTNFDTNYDEFDHIELQFKPSSDNNEQWRKIQYFYADSSKLKQAIASGKDPSLVSIVKGGMIKYNLFLDNQVDQYYDLRAVTFCKNGTQFVTNNSDIVTGIKDMYTPRLYGNIQPENGILGIGDNISLTFNEPISGGLLTEHNFSIWGILNEAPSERNISVHMDGQGKIQSQAAFRLKNEFTIEGYFRQTNKEKQQTLFAMGKYPQMVRLDLDQTGKRLILYVDTMQVDVPFDNKHKWEEGVWNHVAVVCHPLNEGLMQVDVLLNFVSIKYALVEHNVQIIGPLVLGEGLVGNVDQVRVWNTARSMELLRETASIRYNNPVMNLVSCYNMDENEGTTLSDVASARTLSMNSHCNWAVPEGRGLYFDGKSYATIPMAQSSVRDDQDYTLEFWFRTASKAESVIMTTGNVSIPFADEAYTIGISASGNLYIQAGEYMEVPNSKKWLDDNWHHFTLTVSRNNGFARIYMDGLLLSTVSEERVSGLAASQLYVGAMNTSLRTETGYKDSIYNFFTGYMDEIRLWNCYREQYQIEHSHMEKPDSIHPGLVFYYPFERYERSQIGITSLIFSLKNFCMDKSKEQVTLHGAVATPLAAPVATTSAMTQLDNVTGYTFTPGEKGIILNLIAPASRIEHSLLYCAASDVRDVNGNKMASPLSWMVYVDQNPLVVDQDMIEQTLPLGESASFDLMLTNRSGAFQPFTVNNMPTWLTYTAESQMLYPSDVQALHFASIESLPIGTHSAIIYISNSDNTVIPIEITLIVEGQAPDEFTGAEKYQSSMNIIGQIQIDGVLSSDTRDMLLVYDASSNCVGSAHPAYIEQADAYLVNLQVHGNKANTDLVYIIYDASTGKQYKASCAAGVYKFKNDAIIGSFSSPALFHNEKAQCREYKVAEGWNWLSFNLYPSNGWDIDDVFGTLGWCSDDKIKYFNAERYCSYSDYLNTWLGPLTDADAAHLHMVYAKNENSFMLMGEPINPATVHIPIAKGWNGIGYLPQINLSVSEALSLFTTAVNGDVIKSQTQFAIYYDGSWIGSLKTMYPGEGYMLKHLGNATTLTYPSVYANAAAPTRQQAIPYETTMSMVAQPRGIQAHEGDVLTAYCGDEMVGAAELTHGVWYMSISAQRDGSPVYFVYNGQQSQRVSSTSMIYESNAVVGSLLAPQPIEFTQAATTLVAYPSPVQFILYYNLIDGAEQYTIYSLTGECLQQGKATGYAPVSMLPSGAYILEVATSTQTYRTTFIKE